MTTSTPSRNGQLEASRARLLRTVRTAVAGADDESAFFARLEQAGLLVRRRHSIQHPDEITGYAVALPGDRDRQGVSVWYSGGRLAADLSLPQLRRRWQAPTCPAGTTDSADRQRLRDPAARRQAVTTATAAAVSAAEHLAADVAGTPPGNRIRKRWRTPPGRGTLPWLRLSWRLVACVEDSGGTVGGLECRSRRVEESIPGQPRL
ncbi:hypothetical protein [Frankia sp. Cj5]|uniref:hypothetical protein n=1 Tax=Frankia sp. Cj5 TaxID=2880978 RepID=UPI001EF4C6EF|nr:hypothetical protein [Frankia sp. Cj5]